MKPFAKCLAVVLALVSVLSLVTPLIGNTVAHATPSISLYYNAVMTHALAAITTGAGAKLAMFGPLVGLKPVFYSDLKKDANPKDANQPEVYPGYWFDTQLFTSASTSGNVGFFAATNNDKTISNMLLAGQFPADEYFKLGEIHVDLLGRLRQVATTGAASNAVGVADDINQIMLNSRATLLLSYRNKPYGAFPLSTCRPTGGMRAAIAGAFDATTDVQIAQWEAVGLIFEKQLTFAPTSNFGITIFFPSTLTLTQNYNIRVTIRGAHFRPVV